MKRNRILFAPACALSIFFFSGGHASAEEPIHVVIDDKQVQFDAQPEVIDGSTMVPIRAVVESMGAQVQMSGGSSFLINKGDKHIKITWNSALAYVNDQPVKLPLPAYVKHERTYVPLRFVGETFSSTVKYELTSNTVLITTGAQGEDKPLLRFPVISDIHVQARDARAQQKFQAALQDLYSIAPNSDALVINGDLGNGQPGDYETLKGIVQRNPHPPISYTIGNHEFYKAFYNQAGLFADKSFPNGETDQTAVNRFLGLTGEKHVYYDKWIDGYHFLFLGGEKSRMSNPSYMDDAYLSDEQLAWLKEKLNENREPGKPVFLFLHQPLPHTVAGTSEYGVDRAVIQYEPLKNILADHPEVIDFSGHTHYQLRSPGTYLHDLYSMVNSSAVIGPSSGDDKHPLSADESEGLFVEVYKDRVTIRGRDFYRKQWVPEAQFTVQTKPQ